MSKVARTKNNKFFLILNENNSALEIVTTPEHEILEVQSKNYDLSNFTNRSVTEC